jgi:hypothetical protein
MTAMEVSVIFYSTVVFQFFLSTDYPNEIEKAFHGAGADYAD